jgi:hypothetical protein
MSGVSLRGGDKFDDFGLIHYTEPEEGLQFVRRGTLADAE